MVSEVGGPPPSASAKTVSREAQEEEPVTAPEAGFRGPQGQTKILREAPRSGDLAV